MTTEHEKKKQRMCEYYQNKKRKQNRQDRKKLKNISESFLQNL